MRLICLGTGGSPVLTLKRQLNRRQFTFFFSLTDKIDYSKVLYLFSEIANSR